MQKVKLLLVGLSIGGLSLVVATPALAWHPQGKIVKKVQNVTAGSALVDANSKEQAVTAKPGDTLKYVIEVSNPAPAAGNEHNHLYYTVLTDNLPEGVELVSNPAQRKIEENLGVIAPGEKKTKEYLVKVTSNQDSKYLENKACFKGNSKVNDAPRDGCDIAITKVSVPQPPKEPEEPKVPVTPETPETPQQPETPAELPATGPEAIVGVTLMIGAVAYATVYALRSKHFAATK